MGNQKKKEESGCDLIEFLYKDKNYIDSFYSQIFQGDIQKVTKNSTEKQMLTNKLEGGIPTVVKGALQSNEENSEGISQEINPHDSKILKLFSEIEVKMCENIGQSKTNGLNKFHGILNIVDYDIMKERFANLSTSGLLAIGLNQPNIKNDALDKIEQLGMPIENLMNAMLKMYQSGCDMVLTLRNKEKLLVPLEREFLTMNSYDIHRVFGERLPGEWIVVGVLNCVNKLNQGNALSAMLQQLEGVIKTAFEEGTYEYVLKPIAIYRRLK